MTPLRTTWIILIIIGFHVIIHAQLPDSIQQKLSIIIDPADKTDWLIDKAKQTLDYQQTLAHELAQHAIVQAQLSGDKQKEGQANLIMGIVQNQLSQYDSALHYLLTAELFFTEISDSASLAENYLKLHNIHCNIREFHTAMEYALQAAQISEALTDPVGLAKAYGAIARVHLWQEDFEKGLTYCDKALALLEPGTHPKVEADIRMTKGDCLRAKELYELVLVETSKAIELLQKARVPRNQLIGIINSRGNTYKHMERYEGAITDYQNNLTFCKATGNKRCVMVSNANIGHTLVLNQQYQDALPFLHSAIDDMEKSNDRSNLWENYMHVSEAYEALGNYQQSLYFYKLLSDENEEYYEDKIAQLESASQTKFETTQHQATIVLQKQTIAQQRTLKWLMVGLACLLATILALLYINFRNKKRLNTELEIKNQEKELLLKEIHHRVKNNLQTISSLLNLQTSQIKDKKVRNAVVESKNRVRSMALIHQRLYQGKNLAAIEMKQYLETLCQNMIKSFGSSAKNVEFDCPMEVIELDVDTAIPIGLIANELITNSLKYAFTPGDVGKIEVSLTLNEKEQEMRFCVADNGQGIHQINGEAESKGTNFGTQLVRLLSAQLLGEVEITKDNGYKTDIRFKKFKVYHPGQSLVNA